jgi:hypothetical protein
MAFAKDYVDVATRIRDFKNDYPTGSLQQVRVEFHTDRLTDFCSVCCCLLSNP